MRARIPSRKVVFSFAFCGAIGGIVGIFLLRESDKRIDDSSTFAAAANPRPSAGIGNSRSKPAVPTNPLNLKDWLLQNTPTVAEAPPEFWEALRERLRNASVAELEAMARYQADERGEYTMRVLDLVLFSLADRAPDVALKLMSSFSLEQMPSGPLGVIKRIARSDPEALRRWLEAQPDPGLPNSSRIAAGVLMNLGVENIALAFGYVGRLPESDRSKMLGAFATSCRGLKTDEVKKIISQVNEQLPKKEAETFVTGLVYGLAAQDPVAALELALQAPSSSAKDTQLLLVFEKWAKNNPVEALEAMSELDSEQVRKILMTPRQLSALYAAGPDQIIQLIETIPLSSGVLPMFLQAASLLAGDQPERAVQWAETFPAGEAKDQITGEILMQGARQGVDVLESLIGKISPDSSATVFHEAARELGGTDFEGAVGLISQLPTSAREDYFIQAGIGAADKDPKNTINLVSDVLSKNPDIATQKAVSEIAVHAGEKSAATDIQATLPWLQTLPPALAESATFGAIRSWSATNPLGASEWLTTLPDSPVRRSGIRALVEELQALDPQMAASWRAQLGE